MQSENKLCVVLLFGGMSSEHEVSRVSVGNFVNNIDRTKYEVLAVGITKEGRWLYTEATAAQMADGSWEELPGNNCGGCGFPGCDGLAAAIAKGEAPVNACPVGGAAAAAKIAAIMGQEAGENIRMTAFVKCAGDCEKAGKSYDYIGVKDCKMATLMQNGGEKACSYGCLGYGSCVKACGFDAIHIVNGIAVVDKEKCKACGKCVAECPKHLIELIPYQQKQAVACSSKEKGKAVMSACEIGCIGCRKCVKECPSEAITVVDNVAQIDYEKCTNCGKCKETCPRHIIL